MRRYRSSKIVATLGPASSSREMIEKLFLAGVDVFRLNFSHGSHDDHEKNIDHIRAIEKQHNRPIGILMDLQGPKLRIGTFQEGSVILHKGNSFTLTLQAVQGDETHVHFPHPELFSAITVGSELLVDDGKVRLKVTDINKDELHTHVLVGGTLSNRKGVNIPDVALPISPLTSKDRRDLDFGLSKGVDWVALSFVQIPDDIVEAKDLIQDKALLLAKIEKPLALENLDAIIQLSDGIMVARGDLGVEMPAEAVPPVQKRIIHDCRQAGKPVIVATQMLDSMMHVSSPTRAEASDVATAIYDGTDAVMLSGESAAGQFPHESVLMMNRIIRSVEHDPLWLRMLDADVALPEPTASDAITFAAKQVAETISAQVIVAFTESGSTALRAARERPHVPIMGLTPSLKTARQLSLVWGIHAVTNPPCKGFSEAIFSACEKAIEYEFATPDQTIVVTAGIPFGETGSTNSLRIATPKSILP